jgi:hypothetical protein
MIERKRRNDFVRKREFDMLRKVRREGLSPEQLAALGGLVQDRRLRSALFRQPVGPPRRRQGQDRRDRAADGRRASGFAPAPPPAQAGLLRPPAARERPAGGAGTRRRRPRRPTSTRRRGREPDDLTACPRCRPLPDPDLPPRRRRQVPAPVKMAGGLPPLAPMAMSTSIEAVDFNSPLAVEVSEVMHDPELDEAVIAFANADFEQCEQSLQRLTSPAGQRAPARRDLAGAVRPVPRHRPAAALREPGHRLRAAVRLVGAAVVFAAQAGGRRGGRGAAVAQPRPSAVGWICPVRAGHRGGGALRSQTLQMPLPWVFDWGGAEAHRRRSGDAAVDAVPPVGRAGAGNALDRRRPLFTVLPKRRPPACATPTRLLADAPGRAAPGQPRRPVRRAAIDYCVTYEVSPPSWEPARCKVRISGPAGTLSTRTPPMSVLSEVSTPASSSRACSTTPPAPRRWPRRAVGPAGGRHQRHAAR